MAHVTEKYDEHILTIENAKKLIDKIVKESDFTIIKKLFMGKLYDNDKIGTLIYEGIWKKKKTVLKAQFINPETEEAKIIKDFNNQNKSELVRVAEIYKHEPYSDKNGYGYMIMEHIDAPPIFEGLASKEDIKLFIKFYKDYQNNCINEPFVERQWHEKNAFLNTFLRIANWSKIALQKKDLKLKQIGQSSRFLIKMLLSNKDNTMSFMHSHLTSDDIKKVSENELILMSQMFWEHRPKYYDTTFHLWMTIKSMRDLHFTSKQAIDYSELWKENYKKIPQIKNDPNFDQLFALNMTERSIGALLIDIENQEYSNSETAEQEKKHLKKIFEDIFNFYIKEMDTKN
jgi:hypothetical protein